MTRDFRGLHPPRRPDFARSASIAREFMHFGLGNREPGTFRGARSLDAQRDNSRARPRRSARHSATPPRWPTPRDLRAPNSLSQNAVRTPQTRTPRPCGRGAHSEPFGAPVSRAPLEVGRAGRVADRRVGFRFAEGARYPSGAAETWFQLPGRSRSVKPTMPRVALRTCRHRSPRSSRRRT